MTPRPRNATFAIALSPNGFLAVDRLRSTDRQSWTFIQYPVLAQPYENEDLPLDADNLKEVHRMDDNKSKALAAALSQIEKQFGKGSIMKMDDAAIKDIEVVSTGSPRPPPPPPARRFPP